MWGSILFYKYKAREKQNVYEVFFLFLFFISKVHNMRWKKPDFGF